jgi:hypothetical protein
MLQIHYLSINFQEIFNEPVVAKTRLQKVFFALIFVEGTHTINIFTPENLALNKLVI